MAYEDPADARCPDPIWGEGDVHLQFPGAGTCTCTFPAFGTLVTIIAYGEHSLCRAALSQAIADCRAYERRLSTRLAQSDIARLNRSRGQRCAVHRQTAELLQAAQRYCARSRGSFDITVQPAVKLWDFERGILPDKARLADAVTHVNWRGVHAFEAHGEWFAQVDDPMAEVDLGGIAKGWIADQLVQALAQPRWKLAGFSVNLGGNVAVHGCKPDGSAWHVGIRDPRDPEQVLVSVDVRDSAVVTSGIYERCFELDGRRFHHILDPSTGYPAKSDLASASVIANRAIDAEGFSTTLLALGRAHATEVVQGESSIAAAILIGVDGRISFASAGA